MNAIVTAPIEPIVRTQLNFKLDEVPRFWFGGDPFRTRMFDALSLTFPDGERYFIQSVRLFRDQITDPSLAARVSDFIKQEAQHGIAHDKMNQVMREQGMPVDQFIQRLNKIFKFELSKRSPQYNIAMTAAAEHLTALMAETFYSHKATLAEAHPYVRALFAWHAIEEIEHRAVAFDVYQDVYGDDKIRRLIMRIVTTGFASLTFYSASRLFLQDRKKSIPKLGGNLFGLYLLVKMFVQLLPEYLSYYKTNFHPSDIDYSQLLKYWKTRLAEDYQLEGFQQEWHAVV